MTAPSAGDGWRAWPAPAKLNLFLPREASERDVFDPEELIEDAVGTNTLSVNIPDYREQDDRHRRDALPRTARADSSG